MHLCRNTYIYIRYKINLHWKLKTISTLGNLIYQEFFNTLYSKIYSSTTHPNLIYHLFELFFFLNSKICIFMKMLFLLQVKSIITKAKLWKKTLIKVIQSKVMELFNFIFKKALLYHSSTFKQQVSKSCRFYWLNHCLY